MGKDAGAEQQRRNGVRKLILSAIASTFMIGSAHALKHGAATDPEYTQRLGYVNEAISYCEGTEYRLTWADPKMSVEVEEAILNMTDGDMGYYKLGAEKFSDFYNTEVYGGGNNSEQVQRAVASVICAAVDKEQDAVVRAK